MFADDTNAFNDNDDETSIKTVWECLQTHCEAIGSIINQSQDQNQNYQAKTLRFAINIEMQTNTR